MRAIVDLPEPLSPARPKASPLDSLKLTSLTAFTSPLDGPEQSAAHREGLAEADDLQQRLAQATASSRRQQAALWLGPTGRSSGARLHMRDRQRAAGREAAAGRRRAVVGQRPVDAP